MRTQSVLTIEAPPAVRHRARLTRAGTWTQQGYDNGTELTGLALVGTFDGHRFGVREVHALGPSGRPYTHLGVIPASERSLEIYVPTAAPSEIGDQVAAFVRHLDREGRSVVVHHDDYALRAVELAVLWRWRLWRWVRRAVN